MLDDVTALEQFVQQQIPELVVWIQPIDGTDPTPSLE
jgi:hypothetical protein